MFGIDFFGHATLFGIASYFGYRLFRNKPFLFRAIILFCLLNAIGLFRELYQGAVRDWLFDIIANNLGIIIGLIIAHRKSEESGNLIQDKESAEYLESSTKRRLRQRSKNTNKF